jgi:hypothetical protein
MVKFGYEDRGVIGVGGEEGLAAVLVMYEFDKVDHLQRSTRKVTAPQHTREILRKVGLVC